MKRTYVRLLFRGVKKSITRFLSIMAIVMLGVGFLAGLAATAPDMELTADKYYDENATFDINIKSTLGLTDADAQAAGSVEGVKRAFPMYSLDILLQSSDAQSHVARVIGVDMQALKSGGYINGVVFKEGEWPDKSDECLVLIPSGYSSASKINETYLISEENKNIEDIKDRLPFDTLTVTGMVDSPVYMSIESEPSSVGGGFVAIVAFVDASAFDMEAYTDIYVELEGSRELNSFSLEYADKEEAGVSALESLGEERSVIRLSEVKEEAQTELSDAREEYEDKKAEADEKLADARREISDGEKELADAAGQIADGEEKLKKGKNALSAAKKELAEQVAEGERQISEGRALTDDKEAQAFAGKAQLDALKAQLDAAQPAIDALKQIPENLRTPAQQAMIDSFDVQMQAYNSGISAFSGALIEIAAARDQLDRAKSELDSAKADGEKKISAGRRKLKSAEQELAQAKLDYAEGEQNLADAKQEYADAKTEADEKLGDAEQRIDDAQKEIDELEVPEWYVSGRSDNVSYASYKGNVEKIQAIARVFPVFFFVVAALVALTTMTRMVDEERTQIGTLKALGYSDRAVLVYYLSYSGLASLIGSIVGGLIGFILFPKVIANAYSMMYIAPAVETPFWWSYMLLIAPIAISVTVIATLLACFSELKDRPASLLLPRAPKAGKRIFLERIGFIWKRMSFTKKVTARNLLRYKKRFFMTVIGIAGCCALLVTGFGLRDSISDIVDKQFNEIHNFNMTMYVSEEADITENETVSSFLQSKDDVDFWLPVYEEACTIPNGTDEENVTVTVPERTEGLKEAYTLRERKSGEDIPFGEEGVVLTEKLAENLSLSVGGEFILKREDGESAIFTVTGIAENYVYSRAYMSESSYKSAFGEIPEYTMVLAHVSDDSEEKREEYSEALLKSEGISYVSFTAPVRDSFDDALNKINYIVWVLIISAGALAIIVLYNLTNINICERVRELATIKVLGFYEKEVCMYIYKETGILSFIGMLFGLLGGIWLHGFVVRTAEVEVVMFGRDIYATSFLFAAVITILFTVIVDLIMIRRIKKISMVESLKANE